MKVTICAEQRYLDGKFHCIRYKEKGMENDILWEFSNEYRSLSGLARQIRKCGDTFTNIGVEEVESLSGNRAVMRRPLTRKELELLALEASK